MSKTEQIKTILRKRYEPGAVLPFGALTIIAAEVECTRELVRLAAKSLGFRSSHSIPRQACPVCGRPARYSSTLYCSRACAGVNRRKANVVKTCDHCKKDFELSPRMHAIWRHNRRLNPNIRHTFCSRTCSSRFWGATTFSARKAQPA